MVLEDERLVAQALATLSEKERAALVLARSRGPVDPAGGRDPGVEPDDGAVADQHRAGQAASVSRSGVPAGRGEGAMSEAKATEVVGQKWPRCPQNASLLALQAGGDLTARQAASLRRHLDRCAGCRKSLAELRATREWLRSNLTPPVDAASLAELRRRVVRPLAAGATVPLAAGGAGPGLGLLARPELAADARAGGGLARCWWGHSVRSPASTTGSAAGSSSSRPPTRGRSPVRSPGNRPILRTASVAEAEETAESEAPAGARWRLRGSTVRPLAACASRCRRRTPTSASSGLPPTRRTRRRARSAECGEGLPRCSWPSLWARWRRGPARADRRSVGRKTRRETGRQAPGATCARHAGQGVRGQAPERRRPGERLAAAVQRGQRGHVSAERAAQHRDRARFSREPGGHRAGAQAARRAHAPSARRGGSDPGAAGIAPGRVRDSIRRSWSRWSSS